VASRRQSGTLSKADQSDSELAVHKLQGLLPVFLPIALVSRLVISIATVRIGSIAVALDLVVERSAGLTGWTSVELDSSAPPHSTATQGNTTYSTSLTGPNVVRRPSLETWIALEDRGYDVVRGDGAGA